MKNIDSSLESLSNMLDIKDHIGKSPSVTYSEFPTDREAAVGLSHHNIDRGS